MLAKGLSRRDLFVALLAALILGLWCLGQFLLLSTDPSLISRFERLERLGSERSAELRALPVPHTNSIEISGRGRDSGSATWSLLGYEFTRDLAHSSRCELSVYVMGRFTAQSASASATVLLNGLNVATVHDAKSQSDPAKRGFANVEPQPINMTPLYQPSGMVFPIRDTRSCNRSRWEIKLRVHDAIWRVDRVGVASRFTPTLPSGGERFSWLAIAALELVAIEVSLLLLMAAIHRRFGILAVAASVLILIGATLTHDQWDFPIWPRFVDLVAFGHGYPVQMWAGTPLWPILVGALAPLAASGGVFGVLATQEATGIWLKLVLGLLFCATAYAIASWPSSIGSRHRFFVALLAPFGLYELAAGYREILAGSLVLLGFELAWRGRYTAASVAVAAATSVSEILAPALVLPAALSLVSGARPRVGDVGRAIGYATIACGVIALQWLLLIPHETAVTALHSRVEAYRYGGGSWLSVLDYFGQVPDWIPGHSLYLFFSLFALLAVAPIVVTLKAILGAGEVEYRKQRVLGASVAVIASFLLAYRGVDPSTWYGFFVIVTYVLARIEPTNPLPLILSLAGAAAFYAIGGVGDFVDWWFLKPADEGQLGILGVAVPIAVATTTGLIACAYIGGCTKKWHFAAGSLAPYSIVIWAFCGLAGSIRTLWADLILLGAFVALILLALRTADHGVSLQVSPPALRFLSLFSVIALIGMAVRLQSAPATLALLPGLLLYTSESVALSDVVLLASGASLVLLQPGDGWASRAGYDALLIVTGIVVGRLAWRVSRSGS